MEQNREDAKSEAIWRKGLDEGGYVSLGVTGLLQGNSIHKSLCTGAHLGGLGLARKPGEAAEREITAE